MVFCENLEKVFRRIWKLYLGLYYCQTPRVEKQETYIFQFLFCIPGYKFKKFDRKSKNPEQILHTIRSQRPGDWIVKFKTFLEIA